MKIENLDPSAVIKWRLTDTCNFKCSYCIRKPLVNDDHKIKEDDDKCVNALPDIIRIANDLYRNTGKYVKVDLIGGEVTVLPSLQKIIDALTEEEVIEKVNITTNFEVDNIPTGKKISCTASYHPTQTKMSIESWFLKAVKLKDAFNYFKVETVAVKDAAHIERFIQLAKQNSIPYQVEEDLFNKELTGKACSSNKDRMRYRVTDDAGVSKEFPTRNMFLKTYGIEGMQIYSGNKLCSRDFDYVYVEQDRAFMCAVNPISLKDYKVVNKMHPCWRGKDGFCTLCGNISVETIPEFLF